ncbi:MAG: hypothetical protein ACOCR0_03280 [Haloferacaceae archaeon]
MSKTFNIVATALFLVLLLVGANAAYADSGQTQEIDNESISVDYSEDVVVDEDGHDYGDDEVVRNSNDTVLEEGTDYDWDADNGTVEWFNTSDTSDGETASISYSVEQRSQATELSAAVIQPLGSIVWVALFGGVLFGVLRIATLNGGKGGGL